MSEELELDDAFSSFARKVREDQEKRNNFGNFSKSSQSYEEIAWVGLKPGHWQILRFIGNPPESLTPGYKASITDAVELHISDVKNDMGKRMQLKLPVRGDLPEKDFIIWRIIDKVMETTYENKKRVYKWENDPNTKEVFNYVAHGGWNPATETNQYKFSKGWAGQKVCVVNVIDREDMEWHKANKHTKLLSRNISESVNAEGKTTYYPSIGVPSFGFVDILGGIVANYGNWSSYDIGIKRTGAKQNPYTIANATAYKNGGLKDIPENELKFVSTEPLTEEEKSWTKYEIGKIYKPTSYRKLLSNLGNKIKTIDGVFNTRFYDELNDLAKKEAEEMKALNEAAELNKEPDNSDLDAIYGAPASSANASAAESMPTRPTAASVDTIAANERLSPEKLSVLKGYQYLTDEQKNQIEDVILDSDGNIADIKYNTEEQVVACPSCKVPGLMAHTHCLACGMKFD